MEKPNGKPKRFVPVHVQLWSILFSQPAPDFWQFYHITRAKAHKVYPTIPNLIALSPAWHIYSHSLRKNCLMIDSL